MKFIRRLILSSFLFLSLSIGSAFADTCYDPHYGNYECNPEYSGYPDQGQAVMEGAAVGIFLGGALSDGGGYYNNGGGNWGNNNHGHWNGNGGHRGGAGNRGHHR